MPFVFVSAAEAGWQEDPPFTPGFLRDYLIAKRAVERKLLDMGAAGVMPRSGAMLRSCMPRSIGLIPSAVVVQASCGRSS